MGILQWRFRVIERKFARNRKRFLSVADQWKNNGRLDDASSLRKAMKDVESKIIDLRQAFSHGELGVFSLFWRVRRLSRAYRDLKEGVKPVWRQVVETILIVATVVIVLQKFFFTHYCVTSGSAEPNILVGDRIWGNKLCYRFTPVKRGDLVVFGNPRYSTKQVGAVSRFLQDKLSLTIPLLGIGPDAWVKRLIALPGDTIEGRIEDGKSVVYLNGEKLNEPYVNPYPLVAVKKKTGFIDSLLWGSLPILSFFKSQSKLGLMYSYMPDKPLENQPFYSLHETELMRNIYSGQPIFIEAGVADAHDKFGPMRVPEGKYWMMGDNRRGSSDSRDWGFLDSSSVMGRASFITFSIDSEEPLFLFELFKHPIDFWSKKVRWQRVFRRLSPFKSIPAS